MAGARPSATSREPGAENRALHVAKRRPDAAPPKGEFERFAQAHRPALEAALADNLPSPSRGAARLGEAVRSAVLSPGKRVRPLVALAAGQVVGAKLSAPLAVAVAVEFVHAASLVLDDLPSMDDAARRRGEPALHRVYGVATAGTNALFTHALPFQKSTYRFENEPGAQPDVHA